MKRYLSLPDGRKSVKNISSLLFSMGMLLSACGFEPVYGNRENITGTSELLSSIAVQAPPGRQGELLRAELEDHFNPESRSSEAAYTLKTGLESRYEPFIIEQDGTASRYSITYVSPFTLTRHSDNKIVGQGTLQREVTYNVSESDDYATVIVQSNAVERGIIELGEDYKMRMAAIMSHERKAP